LELRIPRALGVDGRMFNPESAPRGDDYFCPSCGTFAILKRGEIKVPHFAHKENSSCTNESITHKTAKLLIIQAVSDWKSGRGPRPAVHRECCICEKYFNQPLPDKVTGAREEQRTEDGHRVDVALLSGDNPVAAIEIYVAHAVDSVKAGQLKLPFVELRGDEVISDPLVWDPDQDYFRTFFCKECKRFERKFTESARQLATETGVSLPASFYRFSIHLCCGCSQPMVVFWWPGSSRKRGWPDVDPPRSVRRGSPSEPAWVNVCPRCGKTQPSLEDEPDGPFALPEFWRDASPGDETDENLRSDMRLIIGLRLKRFGPTGWMWSAEEIPGWRYRRNIL